MSHVFHKKVYIAAGYNTLYFGPGRKEFNPQKPFRPFEDYLKETAEGTASQLANAYFDEGILGSFMSGQFIKQGNLPAFLPFMIPSLAKKPCVGIEGACGTGGRAIAAAVRSILSGLADSVFVAGFEMQNRIKSVYGADVLAAAAYYDKERKAGQAFFFPGIFAERARAYYEKVGYDFARQGMAKWYEQAILNARKNSKAQEYHNTAENLFSLGMTPPDPEKFIPYLNYYDCSKVTDGASSLVVLSEEGLKKCGLTTAEVIEIVGMGEAVEDITKPPKILTELSTSVAAIQKAFEMAKLRIRDIGILEVHDCFTISGLLSLEALGVVKEGEAPAFVMEGQTSKEGSIPTNLSGGLGGFGHPTGATGVRQMVDLWHQLMGKAENQLDSIKPHGMMISMGGNDKTVTAFIVISKK